MITNRNYHLKLVAMFTLLIGACMALIAWVAQPVGAAPPLSQVAPAETTVCGPAWSVAQRLLAARRSRIGRLSRYSPRVRLRQLPSKNDAN